MSTTPTAANAHTTGPAATATASVVSALRDALAGQPPAVVLYFASSSYDPADLAGPFTAAFPDAAVLGCSTAGEFTNSCSGEGGISAVALPESVITRSAVALVDLAADPLGATARAAKEIADDLGTDLRALDPARHVGFVLIDGMHGAEEAVNEALGDAAPFLNVVGGSAGDDLAFQGTWVSVGERVSRNGAALVVCETARPFTVLKTCPFSPTGNKLRVTRADRTTRTVYEFDGRPAAEAYASAIGQAPDQLGSADFMKHPLGLMVDGAPFIRSPQQVTADGGIRFYCEILDGMEVDVMRSGDIVAGTRSAFAAAVEEVGGTAGGAVLFNCILRRLELDANGDLQQFVDAFGGVPVAGFHTYGESWLGHMNQTLTGVVFG